MSLPDAVIVGSYNDGRVALSVAIAVLASYTALDLAGRVASRRDAARVFWLAGGAVAMGTGIWSMHYVGMLAYQFPVEVQYDWPTVLLSLLAAIFASSTALFVVSGERLGAWRAAAGSLCMGSGIAAMHYIGMAAMRLPAECHYSAWIVAASIALAIAVSLVALLLTFHHRASFGGLGKPLSALAMGAAIALMHYTGMAAATFKATSRMQGDLRHALSISSLGIAGIVAVTLMLLGFTGTLALLDRRYTAQLFHNNELVPLLLQSAAEAIFGIDKNGLCTFCNQAFLQMTGYQSFLEVKGKNIHALIHHTKADGSPYPPNECLMQIAFQQSRETHVDDEVMWRKNGSPFSAE